MPWIGVFRVMCPGVTARGKPPPGHVSAPWAVELSGTLWLAAPPGGLGVGEETAQ